MNADELARLCSALSVKEKERPVRTLDSNLIDKGSRRLSLCLVGKVFATKLVNRSAFMDVMTSIWRVNEEVEIEWAEGNIFVLNFKNLEDRKRILIGGPWSFDRAIIVFEEPSGEGDILNMNFSKAEFWIQIHNLPLICMTEDIGIFLGKMIGEVRDIDLETAKEGNGRYIRVRVVISVKEPLMRCLRVDLMGTGKVTTMLLRYERLLDFCFKCSCLGHSLRECSEPGDVKEVSSEANLRLNVWLRAVSPPKRNQARYGNHVHRSWSRQPGFLDFNSGHNNNRRTGEKWQGKDASMEDGSSGDRWRRKCQQTEPRKLEGCIGPSNRCMEHDKGINVSNGKAVHVGKNFGGIMIEGGEKQKELLKSDENRSKRAQDTKDSPTVLAHIGERNEYVGPIYRFGPANGETLSGTNLSTEMVLDSINSGPVIGSDLNQLNPTKVHHGANKWKRLARGISSTDYNSEIGEKNPRAIVEGRISKADSVLIKNAVQLSGLTMGILTAKRRRQALPGSWKECWWLLLLLILWLFQRDWSLRMVHLI
ncbi:hypothetical protein EZV62_019369 [Acer yangbiense]|uniref:CCHC-type domain-containing protein n=1 Tax=Acer yangbiense TaxID=1000413 RepID=A0A5C7HA63_9ROSI|nr:hypothetical protein EZV62_019369 [Acer yangbiense]